MKGDFTRDTFDPRKHYSRVLMQQGRVQLDADWNEQAAILLHYLQTLAADLIGPHGGPGTKNGDNCIAGDGFRITPAGERDFAIGKGRYYVDGLLCENEEDGATYASQRTYALPENARLGSGLYLVYLDVWERHLCYVEVEDAEGEVISPREVALNGPDTATRAQIVWQVKVADKMPDDDDDIAKDKAKVLDAWPYWVQGWQPENRGWLKACAIQADASDTENPCITPPESRYRGAENQLYRVEIHQGGQAGAGATFKWSRENGSVIFPIHNIGDKSVTLEHLGRDAHLGLQVDDWVEIVDDDYTLQNRVEPLLQVEAIDPEQCRVTLRQSPESSVGQDQAKHPFLRRWDQHEVGDQVPTEEGVPIVEGTGDGDWLELEDCVQVQFQPGATYRTGDYWLIPARTATGDVEWPGLPKEPEAQEPHGIEHHYAPLWIIEVGVEGMVAPDPTPTLDCRRCFFPIAG